MPTYRQRTSQQLIECTSTPLRTLVRSLRVSAAAVEAAPDDLHDSRSMAGQRGDVTVTSKEAAGLPLSHPAMSTSAGLVVVVISYKTITLLTQMSSPTEVHKDITQVIVPYHLISPMPAGYSMTTQLGDQEPHPGQKRQTVLPKPPPSHHLTAVWNSLDSLCRPEPIWKGPLTLYYCY